MELETKLTRLNHATSCTEANTSNPNNAHKTEVYSERHQTSKMEGFNR